MEEELIAQRDAAIAVTKELQKQLQHYREVAERTLERRALTAERLRLHAEQQLRTVTEDRAWELQMCNRVLYLSLFFGMIGAVVGWIGGMLVFLAFAQPLLGFFMVLPGMAFGSLVGLTFAKTKMQLANRRREAKRKREARHREVEMAVHSSLDSNDIPLDPIEGIPSHSSEEEEDIHVQQGHDIQSTSTPGMFATTTSILSTGFYVARQTWLASTQIASGLYHTGEYVQGVFQSFSSLPPSSSVATTVSPRAKKVQ